MARGPATQESTVITIPRLMMDSCRLRIIGTTEMYQNRMASKAKQTLLWGSQKKTAAEKQQTLKHDPLAEFRDSVEYLDEGPTALGLRVTAVKGAMCTATLQTAKVKRTEAQRLLFMPGDLCALYGVPQLRMDVVRSADMNHTPDIRTRAFLPRWCAEIKIKFVSPQLSRDTVTNLLWNAGIFVGVGDFRQEKGKGGYGAFRVIGDGDSDAEWDELVETQGRQPQMEALANPEYANSETAELMEFYETRIAGRSGSSEMSVARPAKTSERVGVNGGHA